MLRFSFRLGKILSHFSIMDEETVCLDSVNHTSLIKDYKGLFVKFTKNEAKGIILQRERGKIFKDGDRFIIDSVRSHFVA